MNDKDKSALEHILQETAFIVETTSGLTLEDFRDIEDKKRSVAMTLINIGESWPDCCLVIYVTRINTYRLPK